MQRHAGDRRVLLRHIARTGAFAVALASGSVLFGAVAPAYASPRLAASGSAQISWSRENATGIYHDPAGGLGACITPDAARAAGRYRRAGVVHGAAGTWAWEFVMARANPAGAVWPRPGTDVGGPLTRRRDSGSNAGASVDQAANIVDPRENYYHVSQLYHTGRVGPALAAFARDYPGPWRLRTSVRHHGPFSVGESYAATVAVVARNGRLVPVSGLPASLTHRRGAQVQLTSRVTHRGVVRLRIMPTQAGGFSAAVAVRDLAPASAMLMIPDGGHASGYQFLLRAGATRSASTNFSGRAVPRGFELYVEKLSAVSGKPLAGAVLEVKDLTTGRELGRVVTADAPRPLVDPFTRSGRLDPSHRYELSELKAPAGYYVPADHTRIFSGTAQQRKLTLRVTDPRLPTPSLSTQLQPAPSSPGSQVVQAGDAIGDSVSVSGDDGEQGTLTAKLEAVPAPPDGVCAQASFAAASTLATRTVTVNGAVDGGNQTYAVPAATVSTGGECVSWIDALTLEPSGVRYSTRAGVPAESALVIAPAIHTSVSVPLALDGARVHDDVTVSGDYGQPARLSGSLLGPLRPIHDSCRMLDWAHARVAHEFGPVRVGGNGIYRVGSYLLAPALAGCYSYVDNLRATTNVAALGVVRSSAGQAAETLLAIRPSMRTVSSRLAPDGKLRDAITVAGLDGRPAAVTARLLLAPATDGSCRGVDWGRAQVLGTTVVHTNGSGRYSTRWLGPVHLIRRHASCASFEETMRVRDVTVARTRPGLASETRLLAAAVTRVFQVDSWRIATQACADRVFASLNLPQFRYGSLAWVYDSAYGRACFTEHWQVVSVELPGNSPKLTWLRAINRAVYARGVGHIHLLVPIRHLEPGTITIAWSVGPRAWLKNRPASDRRPQLYFGRS